ncbi:MAG TPA: tetratricopeptide repeat protein [Vicinamibacterales bacterium]|nr:tetratricopeptide repeat protein [Vicinamibacterales bacterium]
MKIESVIFAVAGILFGFLVGWQVGYQKSALEVPPRAAARAPAPAAPSNSAPGSQAPAILDETQVQALRNVADRDPKNAVARAQLGNLYYDAGRYADAIKWYGESVALDPREVSVSTDLGVSYYYNNQPDLAIKQLEHSLQVDPKHTKTLLNLGVVRAFGKQDLKGATEAWRRLVEIAPESPEGRQAKQALDSLASAHGTAVQ